MRGEIGSEIALPPVARKREYRLELRADRARQPSDCLRGGAVGGKFQDQVRAAGGEAGQRVEAGEMCARAIGVGRIERGAQIGARGVAQRVDHVAGPPDPVGGERRDNGDQRVAHGVVPSVSGRCAGKGPAQAILPIAVGPRLSSAPTSIGICHWFTSRPAHGCSPAPKWR